jgi:hypothetical protein
MKKTQLYRIPDESGYNYEDRYLQNNLKFSENKLNSISNHDDNFYSIYSTEADITLLDTKSDDTHANNSPFNLNYNKKPMSLQGFYNQSGNIEKLIEINSSEMIGLLTDSKILQ